MEKKKILKMTQETQPTMRKKYGKNYRHGATRICSTRHTMTEQPLWVLTRNPMLRNLAMLPMNLPLLRIFSQILALPLLKSSCQAEIGFTPLTQKLEFMSRPLQTQLRKDGPSQPTQDRERSNSDIGSTQTKTSENFEKVRQDFEEVGIDDVSTSSIFGMSALDFSAGLESYSQR
jgi:hypothetical protein